MFLAIPQLNKLFSSLAVANLDDFADRCNYFYTTMAFIFCSILIGTKQHFGEPIRCLVDQQYSGSWVAYVHDYCFISERYTIKGPEYENEELAAFDTTSEKQFENYYQWVPFVLAAQALSFYLPHLLWRTLQKMTSLDLELVVGHAVRLRPLAGEQRQNALAHLVQYIEQTRRCGWGLGCVGRFGAVSSVLYVISKFINIANILVQLSIINCFVGDGTLFWGFQLAHHLWSGLDWTYTGFFPRVVFCDYGRTELANVQHKTVQCALSINILNEKIFVMLSLWLMLLFCVTVWNAFSTFCTLLVPPMCEHEVSSLVETSVDFDGNWSFALSQPSPANRNTVHSPLLEKDAEKADSGITDMSVYHNLRKRLNAAAECGGNVDLQEKSDSRQSNHFVRPQEDVLIVSDRSLLHSFITEALRTDGVQMLRFVKDHAGAMIARDIVVSLFTDYRRAEISRIKLRRRRFFSCGTCRGNPLAPAVWCTPTVGQVAAGFSEGAPGAVDQKIPPVINVNPDYIDVADVDEILRSMQCDVDTTEMADDIYPAGILRETFADGTYELSAVNVNGDSGEQRNSDDAKCTKC